jgi:outer membrane protein, multidrug efflux system
MNKYPIFSYFLLFMILFGCKLGPAYNPPSIVVPEDWKGNQPESTNAHDIDYWWEIFGDDNLTALEEMAIRNNPNLQAALQTVFAARAEAGVRKADLYPQLNLTPNYSSTGTLFEIYLPSGISVPGFNLTAPYRVHEMLYQMPLNMNYEIDLWGKLRGKYNSTLLNAQAEEEAFQVVLLTLTTDLASAFFQLRSLDAQIEVLEKTTKTRQENFKLNQSRYDKGLANYLDVSQAETDLANAQATLEDTIRVRILQENQIAVLIGVPSSNFSLEINPIREIPPIIPPGVPSDVLLQRPDVAQAERKMASEHALIGVAYASFFPSLSLTGVLGYSSPDLSNFLKWISRFWMIGSNINQLVFDGGRSSSNVEEAWANFEGASATYRQTVLIAFREVEDALNNIEKQDKQSYYLSKAVEASKKSTQLSMNRYQKGLGTYLDVVDSERSQLQSELNLANLMGVRYLSTIQLIKALGGRWQTSCDYSPFHMTSYVKTVPKPRG